MKKVHVHYEFTLAMVTLNILTSHMKNDGARRNLRDISSPLGSVGEWSLTSC